MEHLNDFIRNDGWKKVKEINGWEETPADGQEQVLAQTFARENGMLDFGI